MYLLAVGRVWKREQKTIISLGTLNLKPEALNLKSWGGFVGNHSSIPYLHPAGVGVYNTAGLKVGDSRIPLGVTLRVPQTLSLDPKPKTVNLKPKP